MLEIIALKFLCDKIGIMALAKGFKKGRWQLLVVISWLLAEFIGAVIGMLLTQDTLLAILFAYPTAYLSYRVIKWKLGTYPDKEDDWIDTIGVQENVAS